MTEKERFMTVQSIALLLTLVGSLSFAAAETPIASRGAALMDACVTCHGPGGRSQGAIPSFDTMPIKDFVAALRAFQTGARQGTVMNRIARGLDEAEIEAVAAYFASVQQR
jgi:sulfide dehydrogenase cytochrome subunit